MLPFVPLMQLSVASQASHRMGSDGYGAAAAAACQDRGDEEVPLLGLLPPAQLAWLLADVAAALMIPAENGG
jgi:hypothetical protein